jgi:hypothetical protein
MRMYPKQLLLIAALASTTMAASCITEREDAIIAVNIENVTATYAITPGATQFNNPANCITKNTADYIDSDLGIVTGGRLVDITVQSIGTFAGNVNGGTITVNGVQVVSYTGPWNSFNTPQSLLTSPLLVRNAAGVNTLIAAIVAGQPVTVCTGGTFSQAATTGMSVKVDVFAQADVQI